ncbi:2'-5' RNA ligase family protein [Motiliproteus sp. SC1-56]|uniref:2'-5' RNA ligase family protein n=1 Tax=Motiliproteus sp. SC1-56 TaxID=2799565 RepID=UPI001A8EBCCB|nr:2'-5' RNA ligase family protein [Motiliproteus sp. SC1-56]
MRSRSMRVLVILMAVLATATTSLWADEDGLIAIDVLIQPDQKMMREAAKWNALMREQTPEGFELDEAHAPHITLIQRFIAKTDLPNVLIAVNAVKAEFNLASLEMTATGLYHIPSGEIGLAGLVVDPTPPLHALQQAIIGAVDIYAQPGGNQSAFVPDKSGTPFDSLLFEYVETFVPNQTGEKFNPHVTIGVAPLEWLKELETQPFDTFSFGADGLAVYQLGNFGTASRRLDRD